MKHQKVFQVHQIEVHFLVFSKKEKKKKEEKRKRKKSINEVVIQELLAFDQEINWTTTLYIYFTISSKLLKLLTEPSKYKTISQI